MLWKKDLLEANFTKLFSIFLLYRVVSWNSFPIYAMLCYAAMYFLYEINCLFIDLNVISNSRHTNKNIFRNPIKGFLRIEIIQGLICLLYSSSLWVFSSIHMDRSFDGARGAFWTNHLKIYLLKLGVTVYISIRFSVIA
jgi:hypothetical protein